MQIMALISTHRKSAASQLPDLKVMASWGELDAKLVGSGVLLDPSGRLRSALEARIQAEGGKITVDAGPFTEAKETTGAYCILQTQSKAEAVELGKRFMQIHLDFEDASFEGELEVRELVDSDGWIETMDDPAQDFF